MIRALLADDEAPARDKLAKWLAEAGDIDVVAKCTDGLSAAQSIEELAPQVAFLDVQMPGLSGLEVAAQLEGGSGPLVVFVTAYDEHAIKAFDLSAIDYLLKPYDKDRLRRTVERVRDRLGSTGAKEAAVAAARRQTQSGERLLVPHGGALKMIETATIEWLEADDNYVHVHCATHDYLLRRTLQDLLTQLGDGRFARIHKSTAVNVAAIHSLTPFFKGDYEIKLRTGQILRLSRRYKDELFARMGR
jgi:two-component system, LytTR family, response regulator